ncbi:MAG: hypothetical protein ACLP1Q_04440 [Solirubrobacteraceae bacterium]|jgi:hypothetical protein
MSKKFLISLAPLLAVVAFAVMPVAAQAAPHWYICKHETTATHEYTDSACSVKLAGKGEYERSRLPFEVEKVVKKTRVKTFGVLTLTNATLGKVKCFVDDHGKIWNTLLAEVGKDEIQVFENYECESVGETCKAGLAVTSEGLPWASELVAGPPIRDKITGIKIRVKCTNPEVNTVFEGELTPEFVNGTQANGGVSFAEFGTGSGHLTSSLVGEGTVTGKDYIIGVENAEQILVINP